MPRCFVYACPRDHSPLHTEGDIAYCSICNAAYQLIKNIWRFVDIANETNRAFIKNYRVVRRAEGWGSRDARYYQSLPDVASDDLHFAIWRIRAISFKTLLTLISPASTLLDVGAGNGWLSYQLWQRGHAVATMDLNDDEMDGLGAQKFYPTRLECAQADMHYMPFMAEQFDAVIFNASLHYATDLRHALDECLRVLKPHGRIFVVDSPLYRSRASGVAMLEAKARDFQIQYGIELTKQQRGFFTFDDFQSSTLKWDWYESVVDLRSAWRAKSARWRGKPEPARFGVMVGQRV